MQEECTDKISPVIGGDFNAILSTRNHYDDSLGINKCLGPNGNDEVNERGRLVVSELLETLNLCNPASFFIKKSYQEKNSSRPSSYPRRRLRPKYSAVPVL